MDGDSGAEFVHNEPGPFSFRIETRPPKLPFIDAEREESKRGTLAP